MFRATAFAESHPLVGRSCVWAVDEAHRANFLTPRDCPRITFAAGPATSATDRSRFLAGAGRVVAFEAAWLARVETAVLYIHEMPPEDFRRIDAGAGYWVTYSSVTPLCVWRQENLLGALAAAGAEVRVLCDFWPLADAVAASTLEFSILRKRNAAPRGQSTPKSAS